MIKEWLQLFRAQTAPVTVFMALAAIMHGTTNLSTIMVIGFYLIIVHWITYGHNSLMDTAMMYDTYDEHKQHHPLVSGKITKNSAHRVIHWSLFLLMIIGIYLSFTISVNVQLSLTFLFSYFITGHMYNDGLSKEAPSAPIVFGLCYSSLIAFGWSLTNDYYGILFYVLICYVFMLTFYQIAVTGALKDLGKEERSNFLQLLGTTLHYDTSKCYDNGDISPTLIRYSPKSILFIFVFKLLSFTVIISYFTNIVNLILSAIFMVLSFINTYTLLDESLYCRGKIIKQSYIDQIYCITLPVFLLLDWTTTLSLLVILAFYYFTMNKYLWGTASYPKV